MIRRALPWLIATAVLAPASAPARPVEWGAGYTADALGVVDGGVVRDAALMARADVWADIDGAILDAPGLTIHIDVMATHGPDFSGKAVGDFQTVSNVQAETRPHVYEAWAQWRASPAFALKAGQIDLNSEFDVQEIGSLFLNSAHGIGPDFSQSGLNGPSIFPMTASALVALIGREKGVQARFGVFDAVAGAHHDPRLPAVRLPGTTGALLVGEVEVPVGSAQVQLGAWTYTTRFDAIVPGMPRARSQGAYALVEGPLHGALSGWARVGLADARANPVAASLSGGLALDVKDLRFGLAFAQARAGGPLRRTLFPAGRARHAETAIELTMAHNLAGWISVQPDVQYIVHPGWDPGLRNALVMGLRVALAWPPAG